MQHFICWFRCIILQIPFSWPTNASTDVSCMHAGDGPKIAVYHTARTLDELAVIAPLLPHTGLFDFHLHLTQDVPTAISNAEESPGCTTDNKFDVSREGGGFQNSSDVLKTIRMSLPLPDFASQENLKPLGISVALNTLTEGPCLLYTSPSPRDRQKSRMPSSA